MVAAGAKGHLVAPEAPETAAAAAATAAALASKLSMNLGQVTGKSSLAEAQHTPATHMHALTPEYAVHSGVCFVL
jgi:hypothetical protein